MKNLAIPFSSTKNTPVKSKFPAFSWLSMGIIVILLPKLLLPDTGPLVLLDEFFTVVLLLLFAGFAVFGFICILKSNRRQPKELLVGLVVVLVVGLALVQSVKLGLDLVQGEQTIHLTDCAVGESRGRRGRVRGYYLEGTDTSGEIHKFTISRNDYYRLRDKHGFWTNWDATVVGYEHTGRVIELR